jgi:CBS domain-containing protein
MEVRDLMVRDLKVLAPDVSVAEAVVRLADARVHGLPVIDHRGRLVGVLSSSDIVEVTAEGATGGSADGMLEETLVRDVMTSPPRTIRPDADVREAARHMLQLDVHRLFVVDGEALVGVIAQSDIVRGVAERSL